MRAGLDHALRFPAPAILRAALREAERRELDCMPLLTTAAAASVGGLKKRGSSGPGGNDAFTSLLLHFDGNFTDASSNAHTLTNTGSCTTSSTQKKFGTEALAPITSGKYLTTPSHASFAFGNGNFVIDFWAYFTAVTGDDSLIGKAGGSSGAAAISMRRRGTSIDFYTTGGSEYTNYSFSLSANTMTHIAFIRSGTTVYAAKDGSIVGSNANWNINLTDQQYDIGRTAAFNSITGYLDEFRISKGTDRSWSGGFTPFTAAYSI